MGATATIVAVAKTELKDSIPVILLWVPDPKSTFVKEGGDVSEEAGQKYPISFWQEAKNADFFQCLHGYQGGIHLVYGENDKYISEELRNKVIEEAKEKNQPHMVLPGQDHSPWEFDIAQKVYQEELAFLKKFI
jgi:hypothetical protein